jgi:nicotinamidase/pyrazinamidase
MGKEVFADVDTQIDFMSPKGKLYVKNSEKIIPRLARLTAFADKNAVAIVSSLDSHTKNDPEFKIFPAHCLKNSPGYAKIKATIAGKTRQVFLTKRSFDLFSNKKSKKIFAEFDTAYVYGVALDYCVKAACLGLASLGLETYLVKDATCPVSAGGGKDALELLKKKRIKFITTAGLMRRLSKCRKK